MPSKSVQPSLPASHLVISWVLIVPLFYFASMAKLWFQSATGNNMVSAAYGNLASSSSAAEHRILDLLVAILILLIVASGRTPLLALYSEGGIFTVLAAMAVISCLWSQFPVTSLSRGFYLALDTLFAAYLINRFNPRQLFSLLQLVGWLCLAFSFVLALFFPRYGVDHTQANYPWRGIYDTKNVCAEMTVFLLSGALFAPASSFVSRSFRATYLALSTFLIVMTHSATGIALLCLLFAYTLGIRAIHSLRRRDHALVLLFAAAILVPAFSAAVSFSANLAYLFGKDSTLTGRTGIWTAALTSIMKRPILGYGYGAFWRGLQGESASASLFNGWMVTHAHNGFLEVWLELGAVGLLIVLYSLVTSFREALRCLPSKKDHYNWYAALVLLIVVYALDEPPLASANNLIWILYMVACLGLSRGVKLIRSGHHAA